MESFLGHMIAGGVFCLFGGQPLTVLGCTGPVSFHPSVLRILFLCLLYLSFSIEYVFVFPSLTHFLFIPRCSSLRRSLLNSATVMVSLPTTNLIHVMNAFPHTTENSFDRNLLSHNAPLDWTLGSLLLSYNCCCGWFSHRQIFHKVRLYSHTELMPKASLSVC